MRLNPKKILAPGFNLLAIFDNNMKLMTRYTFQSNMSNTKNSFLLKEKSGRLDRHHMVCIITGHNSITPILCH